MGGELAAAAELAARRAGRSGRPGENVEEELAAVLTLTRSAAAKLAGHAAAMTRLSGVAAALVSGRIDLPKAGGSPMRPPAWTTSRPRRSRRACCRTRAG